MDHVIQSDTTGTVVVNDEEAPSNVVELDAWRGLEEHNPYLYTLLAQMASSIQELVDFKRDLETTLNDLQDNSSGILGMAMRMFQQK